MTAPTDPNNPGNSTNTAGLGSTGQGNNPLQTSLPDPATGAQQGGPGQGTKTLVYAPDINAYIATATGVIDVSLDITQAQIRRIENGVSSVQLTLNNKKTTSGVGQYTGIIGRMDRITVFLTRIAKLQVFAGYVDSAPFLDLYPTTCTVTASCTLKRLLYTYWDPGLTSSEQILDQTTYQNGGAGGNQVDSGMGAMLEALLVKVGGWDQKSIHIQQFPLQFLQMTIATNVDPQAYAKAVKQMQTLLGFDAGGGGGAGGAAGGIAPGNDAAYNGNIPQAAGTYGGVSLNAAQLQNANIIAGVGKSMGISTAGIDIALMTAMQESTLNNLSGGDRDSVGLFQQRPSQGWGSVAQISDPAYAAGKFYSALNGVSGWQSMAPTNAAQAVQRSAYPDAYAKWQPMAQALTGGAAPGPPGPPGAAPGGAAAAPGGAAGGAGGGGGVPPYAYGLFNTMFQTGAFLNTISDQLTGEKALINDQQLMSMIQAVAKAGLRSFQSAPTGEFVGYYPDYFGIQNKATTVLLEDIEMKNVSVQISDDSFTTHVYTIGDSSDPFGGTMAANPELADLQTQGFVTVEDTDVFKMMINIDPKTNKDYTADAIYKRFGARPLTVNMPMLRDPLMERFQALHLFMLKWAEQYQTNVETTFLPEIFPGMRVELSGHQLTVYVKEVLHTIDRKAGFKTQLTIMAPTTTAGGLPGLPVSRGN